MNTLEKLWYGNIIPCVQFLRGDAEYYNALRKAADQKEIFASRLIYEDNITFEKPMDAQMDVDILAEKKVFITDFQLAVQLLPDASKTTSLE